MVTVHVGLGVRRDGQGFLLNGVEAGLGQLAVYGFGRGRGRDGGWESLAQVDGTPEWKSIGLLRKVVRGMSPGPLSHYNHSLSRGSLLIISKWNSPFPQFLKTERWGLSHRANPEHWFGHGIPSYTGGNYLFGRTHLSLAVTWKEN